MNIGEAARQAGVSAKMIRHYESVGLLPSATRSEAGYRLYSLSDVQVLTFIRHARVLGFSLPQIGELLGLWRNRRRASSTVKALALNHIQQLDQKIESLRAMQTSLQHLADHCHGDNRPECPILEGLADPN